MEQIDRIERGAVDVQLCKLERCRHSPHRDRPDAVIEAVTHWMRRRRRDS
jgi:hypothetical protein